jgi:hypothetical protein
MIGLKVIKKTKTAIAIPVELRPNVPFLQYGMLSFSP